MIQTATAVDRYRSDFETLEERRGAAGPGWLADARRAAFARFADLGFPTARRGNERWKYTNVAPIARATFRHAPAAAAQGVTADRLLGAVPADPSWHTLTFVDGRYAPALSTPATGPAGVTVSSLSHAIASGHPAIEEHLTRLAPLDDGFTALNTAFLHDGALVAVPRDGDAGRPIHLLFVSTGGSEATASYPRALLVAGPNSRLRVVETYVGLHEGPYFTNAVTEVAVEDGAHLEHYRNLLEGAEAFHVGVTRVRQGADSAFFGTSFALGTALARIEFHALLDAPGSTSLIKGLYLTRGAQHLDNHINVDHLKPHCKSDQYFKGVLAGRSRAVYSGRVVVHRDAQKTEAHQHDSNLLLSDGAEVDTKPSLEIYADDVKCGHGATAGAIAEDALFYMQSRGLPPREARALLVRGFASEVVDAVPLESLRAFLDSLFSSALPDADFEGV